MHAKLGAAPAAVCFLEAWRVNMVHLKNVLLAACQIQKPSCLCTAVCQAAHASEKICEYEYAIKAPHRFKMRRTQALPLQKAQQRGGCGYGGQRNMR